MDGQNGIPDGMTVVAALQPQDIQLIQAPQQEEKSMKEAPVALIKTECKDEQAQATVEAGTSNITYLSNNTQVIN